MSDTIDTLEIEVESSASEAIKNLQSLKSEMESFGNSLKSVMGKMSRFGMKDALDKETKQIQTASKGMADSLIQQWNIADKEVQSQVRTLCKDIAKQFGSIDYKTGMMKIPDSAITSMEQLSDLIARNGAEATGAAQEYEKFYNAIKGVSKIYVPKSVKSEFGGDYASMARTIPGLFTTQEKLKQSATELDSIYQDLSQQFPHILPPNIDTEAQQFEAIINAVRQYREERSKLTPLDSNDIGLQADVLEDVINQATEMNKALVQLNQQAQGKEEDNVFSALKKDISGLNNALKTVDLERIQEISSAISSLKTDGDLKTTGMADSVMRLSQAVGMFKNVKPSDFDRIVKSINKMGGINVKNIMTSSGAIRSLAGSLSLLQKAVPGGNLNVKVNASNAGKQNSNTQKIRPAESKLDNSGESIESESKKMDGLANSADNAKGKIASLIKEINELKEKIKGMETGKIKFSDDAVYEDTVRKLRELEKQYDNLKETLQKDDFKIDFGSLPVKLQDIIGSLKSLGSFGFDKFQSGMKSLGNTISNIPNIKTVFGEATFGYIGKLIGDIPDKLSSLTNKIPNVFSKISNIFSAMKSGAIGGLNWVENYLTSVGGLEKGNSEAIKTIEKLKKTIGSISPTKALDSFLGISSGIERVCEEFNKVSEAVSNFKSKVQETFSVTNIFKSVLNGIGSVASGIGEKLKSAFSLSNISSMVTGTFGRIGNVIKSAFSPDNFTSGVKTLASGLKSALKYANPLVSVFESLKKALTGAGNSMQYSGNRGNFLGRALRFVGTQFKFLMTYKVLGIALDSVGEAMGILAQRSSTFNARLSQLIASCKTLGANIASLAVPLVNAFGPALTYIINLLSTAISYINQFLSAFTGKTYTVATAGTYDYAASLDEAGSSASDANDALQEYQKTIMGFDELNVMNSQPDDSGSGGGGGGGGGGASPGFDYSEMEINPEILALVEKIKEIAGQIFDPMQEAWENKGKAVIEAWKGALDSVKQLAIDIGSSFLEVWTNGTGQEFCENILDLVIDIGDAVNVFAKALDDAWNDGGAGTAYVQSIFDSFNAVLELIHSINRSLISVFSNGSGKEMFSNILSIMTNINQSVENLADGFRAAWDWGGRGTQVIQNIADIVNILLGYVNNVAKSFSNWTMSLDYGAFIDGLNEILESVKNGNFERVGEIVGNGITSVLQCIDDFITWEPIKNGVATIATKIADFLNGFINGMDWNLLGKTFADGLNLVIDFAYNFVTTFKWGNFGTAIGDAIDGFLSNLEWKKLADTFYRGIVGVFDVIWNAIDAISWDKYAKQLADWLSDIDFPQIGRNVGTSLSNVFQKLYSFISSSSVQKGVKEIATGIAEFLNKAIINFNWTSLGSTLANGVNTIINFAYNFVSTFDWGAFGTRIGVAIQTFIEDVDWETLGKTFSGFVEGMLDMIHNAKDAIDWVGFGEEIGSCFGSIDWLGILADIGGLIVQGFISNIQMKVGKKIGEFKTIGENIINGIFQGVTNVMSGIDTWLENSIVGPFYIGLKDLFGIHSPSTVMAEIGEYLIEGLLKGITDFFSDPIGWIKEHITNPFTEKIPQAWDKLKENTGKAWENIKKNVVDPAKELKEKASEKVSTLVSDGKKKWDEFKQNTSKTWTDAKKSVTDAAENFKSKASEKIKTLVSDGKSKWDDLKSSTSSKWSDIKKSISDNVDNAKSNASTAVSNIKQNLSDAFGNIKSDASTKWNDIKSNITTALDNAKSTASTTASNLKTSVVETFSNLKTDASTKWSEIKTSITDNFNNAKSTASTTASNLKTSVADTFNSLKSDTSTKWSNIKQSISDAMNNAKSNAGSSASSLKSNIASYFSSLKSDVSTKWSNIKTSINNSMSGAKSSATSAANSLKTSIGSTFKNTLSAAKTTWNNIKKGMVSPIESAKTSIKKIVDTVKGFFNFTFKWPHVSLPHFAISPKGWTAGDLLKGQIPKLSIEWYAKGGILNGAQIFGMMGNKMLGGGEAGAEAVLPLKELWKQMKDIFNDLFQKYMNEDELEPALRNIAENIKSSISTKTTITFSGMKDTVTDTSLKSIIGQLMEKWQISDPSEWDIPDVEQILETVKNFKLPTVQELSDTYKNVILPEIQSSMQMISDAIGNYEPSNNTVISEISSQTTTLMVPEDKQSTINDYIKSAIEKISGMVQGFQIPSIDEIKASISSAIEKIKSYFNAPDFSEIVDSVNNLQIPTAEEFINTFKTVVIPEFENMAQTAANLIGSYVPSGSPVTPEDLNDAYNRRIEQSNAMLNDAIEKMRQSEETDMENLMYQMGESVYENVRAAITSTQGNNSNNQSQAPVINLTIKSDSVTLYRHILKAQKEYNERYNASVTL